MRENVGALVLVFFSEFFWASQCEKEFAVDFALFVAFWSLQSYQKHQHLKN